MDKKLTAILLRASDLRESDKSVRLFSAEEGVVSAVMKGVRKPNAKLKFAAQPFALCVYELNEKAGRFTVTGAAQIEDLYSMAAEPEKYAAACLLLEATEKAAESVEPQKLFVILLKSLKALLLDAVRPALVAAKFLQKTLSMSGFISVPEKKDVLPDTPSRVLDYIAYKTLEQLAGVSVPAATLKKTVLLIARRFEGVYEAGLSSLAVFTAMLA